MAQKTVQPTPHQSAGKAPHIYELIVQQHQATSPLSANTEVEIIVTLGGSAFYTYPYRT